MTDKELAKLLDRYMNGVSSDEETCELFEYIDNPHNEHQIKETIGDALHNEPGIDALPVHRLNAILSQILEHETPVAKLPQGRQKRHWPPIAVAASILLVIGLGGWFFLLHKKIPFSQYTNNTVARKQIVPGGNKAIITLSYGTNITLGNAKIGRLATQGNTQIDQTKNGPIRYVAKRIADSKPSDALMYNTASTPRGGQYEFVLSDGTKVWLNASSSIRFPVVFKGSERRVQITGEAYFEVVHDAAKPFRVEARGQTVEVLGTHFNVNSYDDEASVKTTLLEGSVKVTAEGCNAIIKPGEQSDLKDGKLSVNKVDVDGVVAWKNGYFIFDNEDIRSVMKLISRWYDVDVTYHLSKNVRVGGTFSKAENLDHLLKSFELIGNIHCDLNERRIIVSN
jgi:ferric-dicitrate binding protein FerR (iron transport regulator)